MKTKAGMPLSLLMTWLPVFSRENAPKWAQSNEKSQTCLYQYMCMLKSHVTHLERSDSLSSVSQLLGFWEAFSTDTMKGCSHFQWYYLRHLTLVISSPHALHVCEQVDSQQAQCEINELNNASFKFLLFCCHLSYYYINDPQEKYFWEVRFSYQAGVINTLPREMRSTITLLSLYLWNGC